MALFTILASNPVLTSGYNINIKMYYKENSTPDSNNQLPSPESKI
jgi:hypothetical protein